MLRTALGPLIAGHLEDPGVVEVMLNPDGRLWIDRLSGGLEDTGSRVGPADAERIVRLVAHHVGLEVHAGSPRISAELPESGERFEGLVPPVVAAPCFAIRRPAVAVFTLGDYVQAGIMTCLQADLLRAAVRERKNILVAGGTSSGKTTLVNALLSEIAKTGDRVVLIEDTRELQCAAPNLVALRTKDGAATLSDLVRSGSGPIVFRSARYVAQRRWIFSRPGALGIPVASAHCTPALPWGRSAVSSSSSWKRSSRSLVH
jgi:P-type conjugative transfer ATPase TrbB